MSEKSKELTPAQTAGCLSALWSLFVTVPMWLFILFGVLQSIGDSVPVWLWVLYWCYIPAFIVGSAVSSLWKALSEHE